MTEQVRGLISDRPWGLTFGQFALRQVTGQLTVNASDGKLYRVAFDHGSIVGATSPQPADSAIRVALTANLIMSSQVSRISRELIARPDDDVRVVSSVCRLDPAQTLTLRRRAITQRAARTFSIEQGGFLFDDEITIPMTSDAAVDVRAVVYQGARMNLSELRLVNELRMLGSFFTLAETGTANADLFGLDPAERPILDELRERTSVAEIEARHRELDPRSVQSVIYALVACRDVTVIDDGAPARTTTQLAPGQQTGSRDLSVSFNVATAAKPRTATVERTQRPVTPHGVVEVDSRPRAHDPRSEDAPSLPLAMTDSGPTVSRTGTMKGGPEARRPSEPIISVSRTVTPPSSPRTTTPLPDEELRRPETAATGSQPGQRPVGRTALPSTIPPFQPREPPPAVAVRASLPPVSHTAPGSARVPQVDDPPASARTGSSNPSPPDPLPRASSSNPQLPRASSSNPGMPRTGSPSGSFAVSRTISQNPTGAPKETRDYSDGTDRVRQSLDEAADAFHQGCEALRDDKIDLALEHLTRATTLNPHEFEHSALLAWAQFLRASPVERTKSADKVRKMLNHAIQKSREPEQARFYLGQMEKLLGRDKEALALFQTVLRAMPEHAKAAAEVAAIEGKQSEKSGGWFRKK